MRTLPTDVVAQLDLVGRTRASERYVVALYGRPDATPLDETARDDYCAYAADLIERYPFIKDLIVWNEPNKSYFWQPQFDELGCERCAGGLRRAPRALLGRPPRSATGGEPDRPRDSAQRETTCQMRGATSRIRRGSSSGRWGSPTGSSGRDEPIFDTVGHHAYGPNSAAPPATDHRGSTISEGDYADLIEVAIRGLLRDGPGGPGRVHRGALHLHLVPRERVSDDRDSRKSFRCTPVRRTSRRSRPRSRGRSSSGPSSLHTANPTSGATSTS